MIKKSLCMVLAVVLICSVLIVTSYAADVTATPTKSILNINKNTVSLEGYIINDTNYFKLRDLAMVIKDNGKNFAVNWDRETNGVWLWSGQSYNPVGGELAVSGNTASVKASLTESKVYLDGKLIYLTAYMIGNANYIKLRDLGAALDVAVTFDETINMISVDSWNEYYVTTSMDILESAYYDTTKKTITYSSAFSGSITIEKKDTTHFVVSGNSISGATASKFSTIIGLFVNSPETVIKTLDGLKYNGFKELQLDGKTLNCIYDGNTQSVDIKW